MAKQSTKTSTEPRCPSLPRLLTFPTHAPVLDESGAQKTGEFESKNVTWRLVLPGEGWPIVALEHGLRITSALTMTVAAMQSAGGALEGTDEGQLYAAALGSQHLLVQIATLYYIREAEPIFLESSWTERQAELERAAWPFTQENLEEMLGDFFDYWKASSAAIRRSLPPRTEKAPKLSAGAGA